MRIAELSARSGVSTPTIKYYIREAMLRPGVRVNARSSDYDESHVRRLALIRVLTHSIGLSVEKTRTILGVLDSSEAGFIQGMAIVHEALPPYRDVDLQAAEVAAELAEARELLLELGLGHDETRIGVPVLVRQFARALRATADAGMPLDIDHLRAYAAAARQIAAADVTQMSTILATEALELAVAATTLFESVLLSLRRIAQMDAMLAILDAPRGLIGVQAAQQKE
ncbi:MerR family transcriptional regulator [Luethyella okanaganae]|uniref:MerR family transcriptional regulator n=1 Tax=Luethyella okanaganae TaxID=69372 RepID=A0ABW1VKA6_9MICO